MADERCGICNSNWIWIIIAVIFIIHVCPGLFGSGFCF